MVIPHHLHTRVNGIRILEYLIRVISFCSVIHGFKVFLVLRITYHVTARKFSILKELHCLSG